MSILHDPPGDIAPASETITESIIAVLAPVVSIRFAILRECVNLRRRRLGLQPVEGIGVDLWKLENRGIVEGEDRADGRWYGLTRHREGAA